MAKEMAKIYSIGMSWKDNYVVYDDSDSQTDYFHGYSLGQRSTVEWVEKDGADIIRVDVTNDDERIPYMRRLKQIAEKCCYKIVDISGEYSPPIAGRKRLEFRLERDEAAYAFKKL